MSYLPQQIGQSGVFRDWSSLNRILSLSYENMTVLRDAKSLYIDYFSLQLLGAEHPKYLSLIPYSKMADELWDEIQNLELGQEDPA